MLFGDMNDPESEISRAAAENAIQVIKPESGTDPYTFYIALDIESVESKKPEEDRK
jgi:Fe-S-cluster-containing dehydrogenase component